jgi:uncharacterized protein involved in exopolysaccharide biosynthesis
MIDKLEKRLAHIEHKLDNELLVEQHTTTNSTTGYKINQQNQNDEIDLRALWNIVWAGKFRIMAITGIFAIVSVFYALSLPNMYKATIVLAPAQTASKSGMGSLASQYGGLAAMAGINLGDDTSRIDQAVELMKSWPFLENFVIKYNVKPEIMAVEGWSKKTNELIYDFDIYNPETKMWTLDVDEGEDPEPSSWKTYKELSKMLTVLNDKTTGMLEITVEHYSPQIAYEWVLLLKQQINSFYQQQDILESQKNIDYLKAKIAQTNITEMQSVFYNMIESQTKTLMLAEVSDQYLIKTVVPAKRAEEKSRPFRSLLIILATFTGIIIAIFIILVIALKTNKEET